MRRLLAWLDMRLWDAENWVYFNVRPYRAWRSFRSSRALALYGYTFLTRARWFSDDLTRVDGSRFIWRRSTRPGDGWELSLLGVANGLPLFSRFWRLCAVVADGKKVEGYRIARVGEVTRRAEVLGGLNIARITVEARVREEGPSK